MNGIENLKTEKIDGTESDFTDNLNKALMTALNDANRIGGGQ
jgi:hypothetical protein